MSRVRVKICGITSLKDLNMVVEAGADAVGFVVNVPQSPRNLSIEKSRKLIKATPIFVKTVVVTVPKSLNLLRKLYEELNPNIIQVHGSIHLLRELQNKLPNVSIIVGIQVKSELTMKLVLEDVNNFDAIILDSYVQGRYGGTGRTHDWNFSRKVRESIFPKPLILAGGLNPKNVKEAINIVQPYAVDVSSGVESHSRIKGREKVVEFIKNVKEVRV